jgi:hypothetical protein
VMLARRFLPPCLSVIAIPTRTLCLRGWLAERRVVPGGADARYPFPSDAFVLPHYRIAECVIEMGHMWPAPFSEASIAKAARATWPPGRRQIVYTLFHGETHQVMSGRVEFDLVSPSAVPVVRAQHRRVLVRHVCPLNRLCLSKRPTEGVLLNAGPCCSLADYRLTQRPVGRKQVVLGERTRLIQDFVIHDSYVYTRLSFR